MVIINHMTKKLIEQYHCSEKLYLTLIDDKIIKSPSIKDVANIKK